MRTAKTHYEKVPLEIVKRIAEQPSTDKAASSFGHMGNGEMTDENDQGRQYPGWQKLCQEALIEIDKDKLKERVAAAEAAVFRRLQELAHSADGQAERQALLDVTNSLRFLKRDVLKFPDWESKAKP
jgi:hypothetical protein